VQETASSRSKSHTGLCHEEHVQRMRGPLHRESIQVFISSKMREDALKAERDAARKAIRGLGFASAWDWESHGVAGPRRPMTVCLQAVRQSQAIVLLLGTDLTPNTKREHRLAVSLHIPDFIFAKEGERTPDADRYLNANKRRATVSDFRTVEELRALVSVSIRNHFVRVCRDSVGLPKLGNESPGAGITRGKPSDGKAKM
jgi:hypothetical protein